MPVHIPVLYNDWWVYLRDMIVSPYGSSYLNPSRYQIHNAYKIRAALQAQGYCETAIAGVIGNAQVESGITPGAIQKYSVLPNGAERIEDVPNSYMLQYYNPPAGGMGYGLGILQWDRLSSLYQTNDLLGWTDANGYNWYDGDGQMERLLFEYNTDSYYHFWRHNYGTITWADFKDIENVEPTWHADAAADVWASCWELSSLDPTGRQHRMENALFWYDYFQAHPVEGFGFPWMVPVFTQKRKVLKNVRRC